MACNGMGMLRDPNPTDRAGGELLQCDPKNWKNYQAAFSPLAGRNARGDLERENAEAVGHRTGSVTRNGVLR